MQSPNPSGCSAPRHLFAALRSQRCSLEFSRCSLPRICPLHHSSACLCPAGMGVVPPGSVPRHLAGPRFSFHHQRCPVRAVPLVPTSDVVSGPVRPLLGVASLHSDTAVLCRGAAGTQVSSGSSQPRRSDGAAAQSRAGEQSRGRAVVRAAASAHISSPHLRCSHLPTAVFGDREAVCGVSRAVRSHRLPGCALLPLAGLSPRPRCAARSRAEQLPFCSQWSHSHNHLLLILSATSIKLFVETN